MRILVNGAKGRMGQAIIATAEESDATIVAATDYGDDPAQFIAKADAIIDFSFHEATRGLVNLAVKHGTPMVIGTTGHSPEERAAITELTAKIPVVWAGNYSVGVNVLNFLTAKAAAILSDDYNPEIVEMHHRHKRDAPSGTAERLLEIVLEARDITRENIRHGRSGIVGARPAAEVGMHALRGGSVIGDHTVIFAGEGERVELKHIASDRRIFALGAHRAARWVTTQSPGLYTMEDVLGLR